MSGVRRALVIATAERGILSLLAVGQAALLARLLTPAEMGLAMIGMAATQVADALRDFGTTTYLIQHRNLTRESVHTAFTVLLVICCGIALLLALAAAPFAASYNQPALVPYLRVLAVGFLPVPFSAPVMALMRRRMDFRALAAVNISSAAVSAVVVLGLAASGFSHMSIAWANVAAAATAAVVALTIGRWTGETSGGFRLSLREWRIALSFGGYSSATTLMNRAYDLLPIFLLGARFPLDIVGLYSRAVVVSQMPDRLLLTSLAGIVLPAFAADARDGRALRDAYLSALSLLTVVLWPALVLLAILAQPAVDILLGAQWHEAVPLVRIMALAALWTAGAVLSYPVLVASGGLRDTMTSSLVSLSLSSLVVCAAAPHGVETLVLSLFVTLPLQALVAMIYIRRRVGFRWAELFGAVRKSAFVTAATGAPPLFMTISAGPEGLGPPLALLAGASAAASWLFAVVTVDHPIVDHLRVMIELLMSRMRRRRQPSQA